MTDAHSIFSPSAAHRWIECPASIQATRYLRETGVIPEEGASKYAEEGTLAHEFAAQALESGKTVLDVVGEAFEGSDVEAIEEYVDYVRFLAEDSEGVLFIEQKVAVPTVDETCFGTVDAAVVTDDLIHVIDLKFGKGVPVNAIRNHQMMIYAAGLLTDNLMFAKVPEDDFRVILHIVMPRIPSSRYPSDYNQIWETSAGEIRSFIAIASIAAAKVSEQMEIGGMPNSGYRPSEKGCQWCPVGAVCKPRQQWVLADFQNLDVENLHVLVDEELQSVFLQRKAVASYLKAVEEHIDSIFGEDDECDRFPKLEMGSGRPSSAWANEEDVVRAFEQAGEDPWEKKLKGITQARKVIKPKAAVDALIAYTPGKRVLREKKSVKG